MSTTHKATPYAREYVAGTELFLASDYPLSYSLGLEIAEALGERLTDANDPASADCDSSDKSDIIYETLDAVFPVYYSEILKEWQDAGCPEPVEYDFGKGIWDQMRAGLYESMITFTYALIGDADTMEDTLERLNTIYRHITN
jgi:hypothetical protein